MSSRDSHNKLKEMFKKECEMLKTSRPAHLVYGPEVQALMGEYLKGGGSWSLMTETLGIAFQAYRTIGYRAIGDFDPAYVERVRASRVRRDCGAGCTGAKYGKGCRSGSLEERLEQRKRDLADWARWKEEEEDQLAAWEAEKAAKEEAELRAPASYFACKGTKHRYAVEV